MCRGNVARTAFSVETVVLVGLVWNPADGMIPVFLQLRGAPAPRPWRIATDANAQPCAFSLPPYA